MVYYTIKTSATSLLKEKGSRFLGFAYSVANETEVSEILKIVRKKYYDATHHCYAYVIGLSRQAYKAADDGEPSHSAGDPILGQIRSKELTNTLVIVVRYYGGTKLGTGGLVTAYKQTAQIALEACNRIETFETTKLEILYSYSQIPLVNRLVDTFQLQVFMTDYLEHCQMIAFIRSAQVDSFSKTASEQGLKFSFKEND
jgi:uncharacterized YigZ family protein